MWDQRSDHVHDVDHALDLRAVIHHYLPLVLRVVLRERIISQNNNIETNRLIRFAESEFESYDANVQNVKRDHFDYLIYVLLFEDCVKIFQIKKELIATMLFAEI